EPLAWSDRRIARLNREADVPSYIERYRAGDHEAVWSELTALGPAVRQEPVYTEARAVARETMRRVRANVETGTDPLRQTGYRFGQLSRRHGLRGETEPPVPAPGYLGPLTDPPPDIQSRIERTEAHYGALPLSLRAWYETIGTIDFRGHHPEWQPCLGEG